MHWLCILSPQNMNPTTCVYGLCTVQNTLSITKLIFLKRELQHKQWDTIVRPVKKKRPAQKILGSSCLPKAHWTPSKIRVGAAGPGRPNLEIPIPKLNPRHKVGWALGLGHWTNSRLVGGLRPIFNFCEQYGRERLFWLMTNLIFFLFSFFGGSG